MLNSAEIPDSEPLISVGIILPEDNAKTVELSLPTDESYLLSGINEASDIEMTGKDIRIELLSDGISVICDNNSLADLDKDAVLIFSPLKARTAAPQSGIILKNIRSGRNFHWEKRIDVYLPGTVIIKYSKDNLLLINELSLEIYLMCVATSEMGAASPPALIEAQTIAARSWLLAAAEQKHKDLGIDACNDDCCQRYQGTTYLSEQSITGALNTSGQVLLYNGKICDARYSKSCGGMTEAYHHIWEGKPIPYLSSLPDMPEMKEWPELTDEMQFREWIMNPPETAFCSPQIIPENNLKKYLGSVDEEGRYYRWEIKLYQEELSENIKRNLNIKVQKVSDLIPLERGESGRIMRLKIIYTDDTGNTDEYILRSEYEIRQSLHQSFLYSSAFIITKKINKNETFPQYFKLNGAGWGHGAGLCQIGALGMALNGYSAEEILTHYYKDSTLEKIY